MGKLVVLTATAAWHEGWCATTDDRVRYAFEVACNPEDLDYRARLSLDALGVNCLVSGSGFLLLNCLP